MKTQSGIKPNRHDLILAVVILAAAGICALFIHFHNTEMDGDGASGVTASVNGEEYGSWSLDEDQRVTFDTEYGHNVLEIKDGEARMIEADCPDGYCMQQSAISAEHPERTIVCLPHRLVIRSVPGGSANADSSGAENSAQSGEDDGIDAVAGH